MICQDKYSFTGDWARIIREEFFSRSLSSRVSFNLQGAQRFTDFSRLFIQSLRIGRTKMSASLMNLKKSWKSLLLNQNNWDWEFTKTVIPFALVGYELIITNSRYALVGYLSPHIQCSLME